MSTRTRQSTIGAIRRALTEAPEIGRRLWLILVFAFAGTGVQILVPVIVQRALDQHISVTSVEVGAVMTSVWIALGLMVAGGLLTRSALVRMVRQTSAGLSTLRVSVFGHLMKRSVLTVQEERRGALVSRVTSDISTLQHFLEWGGVMFLVNGTQVIMAFLVMALYQWKLALIVLAGVVVYASNLIWTQRFLARRHDRVRESVADSLAVMGEAINALPEVRAHGAEQVTMTRVADSLEKRFWAQFRAAHFGNVMFATAEVFAAGLTAVVIVAGIILGPEQGVTAGVLLAFLFLVTLLIGPVQTMVEILDVAQSAASGLRRITRTLDAPIEIPEDPDPQDLPAGMLGVTFDDVGFAYIEGPEVLSDVTVAVAPGARLAIVGETGSGKTTFAKLLVRLLDPSRGVVRIGGIDLRRVSWNSLRSRVAFVPQEGFLFTGTIAANVRYGHPGATDAEVAAAFHELDLDEWLGRMPEGIHTEVGERGSSLSSGERQLVALVRAWISSPDLLVLDEATSAVDPALDVALRHAIDRLIAGRTSITIAHRLATAEAADRVLVFDAGRLVEEGRHRDLIAAGGIYASLYADWTAGTAVV